MSAKPSPPVVAGAAERNSPAAAQLAASAGIGGESAKPPLFVTTAPGVGVALGCGVGLEAAEELHALSRSADSSASTVSIGKSARERAVGRQYETCRVERRRIP